MKKNLFYEIWWNIWNTSTHSLPFVTEWFPLSGAMPPTATRGAEVVQDIPGTEGTTTPLRCTTLTTNKQLHSHYFGGFRSWPTWVASMHNATGGIHAYISNVHTIVSNDYWPAARVSAPTSERIINIHLLPSSQSHRVLVSLTPLNMLKHTNEKTDDIYVFDYKTL